jgi:F-type H+-transporting ATPase subunit delta
VEGVYRKHVELSVEVNPDLIGGVQVRVGNTLFDGSLKSALEELNERLLGAQIGSA